jgi:hypothetical protein
MSICLCPAPADLWRVERFDPIGVALPSAWIEPVIALAGFAEGSDGRFAAVAPVVPTHLCSDAAEAVDPDDEKVTVRLAASTPSGSRGSGSPCTCRSCRSRPGTPATTSSSRSPTQTRRPPRCRSCTSTAARGAPPRTRKPSRR